METNGNGMPVSGRAPMTPPMLTNAWTTIQVVTPMTTSEAKRSSVRRAIRKPSQPSAKNPHRTPIAPTRPKLLPMIA